MTPFPVESILPHPSTTDDEDEVPYYCISDSCCRLCRFGLRNGDLIVAKVDCERFSCEFPFILNDVFYDDEIFGIKFHMCDRPCAYRGRRVPGFHATCFDFRLFPITQMFLDATTYSFPPPHCYGQQRRNRITSLLVPKLNEALRNRLPSEVLALVAKLLVRECATVTGQAQAQEHSASEYLVDLSRNVYARYHVVDGVRYVKSLENSPSETNKERQQLLLDVQKQGIVQKIVIVEDHLGIRLVKFHSLNDVLPESRPVLKGWWRNISKPSGISAIRVKTDQVKIRDLLEHSETRSSAHVSVSWTTSDHPTEVVDLLSLERLQEQSKTIRMSYFTCNAPNILGYSVATNGMRVLAIHGHRQADDLQYYRKYDGSLRSIFWVYMPVDQGEYVTEIFQRYGLRHVKEDWLGLALITNRGRCTLFGCFDYSDSEKLESVYAPQRSTSRIYFNVWDSIPEHGIRYLAFEGASPRTKRIISSPIKPSSPLPFTQYNETWFFSSCNTDGITDIVLCRDISLGHRPIIGMHIYYANKHTACLGQIRHDRAMERILIEDVTCIYIGSRRTMQRFLYVAHVSINPHCEQSQTSWISVHLDGILEWWFSPRHSIIRYSSRPDTRSEYG